MVSALKLTHDEALSTFAFKFKLRRYNTVIKNDGEEQNVVWLIALKVRRRRLTLSNPRRKRLDLSS